jgi:hypothetical protein
MANPLFDLGAFAAFRTYDAGVSAASVADDLQEHITPYALFRFPKKTHDAWAVVEIDDEILRLLREHEGDVRSALSLFPSTNRGPKPRPLVTQIVDQPVLAHIEQLISTRPLPTDAMKILVDGTRVCGLHPAGRLPPTTASLYPRVNANRWTAADDVVVEFTVTFDSTAAGALATVLKVQFPDGKETVDLEIEVSSREFEPVNARDEWFGSITVDRELGCTPSAFHFNARALGTRTQYSLDISFHCEGRQLGSVTATCQGGLQARPDTPPKTTTTSIDFPNSSLPCDAVRISQQGTGYVVRLYRPREGWSPPTAEWHIDGNFYFQKLEAAQTLDSLAAVSSSLYQDLPIELRQFLDEGAAESPLVIFSDTRVAPFEVVELRPEAGGRWLGVERAVSRWTLNHALYSAEMRRADHVVCIRPQYTAENDQLPRAVDEETELQTLVHDRMVPVRSSADMLEALARTDVGLVHFAGHADGAPPRLRLADGPLVPNSFHPRYPLMHGRPFFYLNGCRAGIGADAPAMAANFAKMLIGYSSAIVAPFVSVNSDAAALAAKEFYEETASCSVVEAARRIREKATNNPSPAATLSFLSYLVFASPDLHLDLSQ